MKNQLRSLLYSSILLFMNSVGAQPDVQEKLAVASGNHSAMLCESTGRGARSCMEYSLPKALGQTDEIILSELIDGAQFSFITIGPKKSGLCALKPDSNKLICSAIAAPSMKGIEISIITDEERGPAVQFVPATSIAQHDGHARAQLFMSGLMQAQKTVTAILSTKSTANENSSKSNAAARIAADGGCYEDSEGATYCPDDHGGGSGGGGGGGGGGTSCVYGPITVCSVPGTPLPPDVPSPAPAPALPGLCQLTGLNCTNTAPPAAPSSSEEHAAQCLKDYDFDMEFCSSIRAMYGHREWIACKTRAGKALAACLRRK